MPDPKSPPKADDEPLELDLEASPTPNRKPAAPSGRTAKGSDPGARAARSGPSDFKANVSNPGLRAPPGQAISNSSLNRPSSEGPKARPSRPFRDSSSALSRLLAVAARWLVAASLFGFSKARQHGGKALSDFNQRPEHTRWRSYAFSIYGALVVSTFAIQLWEPNSLAAYVRVQKVALPDSTVIFVRNESKKPWKEVKLVLNGLYSYERNELTPSSHVQLPVDRFGIYDPSGKVTYAPKELVLKILTIDCDRGHYEQELDK